MRDYLPDMITGLGAVVLGVGLWWISPAWALMAWGGLLMGYGLLMARGGS